MTTIYINYDGFKIKYCFYKFHVNGIRTPICKHLVLDIIKTHKLNKIKL